ncbi:Carbonic anhydrase [Penicillium majusculum]|nr:Carbonic anhydrase [Penicillium majusculum]
MDPADRYAAGLRLNKEWAAQTARKYPNLFPTLATGQTPQILWIGCSDSRCPETTFLGLEPGDVFVHRNIANVLHPGDLSSLSNTPCNTCASITSWYAGTHPAVVSRPPWATRTWVFWTRGCFPFASCSLPSNEAASKLAELNVREGLNIVKQKSVVLNAIREWGLQLHGLIYDVGSGVLSELDTQDSEEVIRARLTAFHTE